MGTVAVGVFAIGVGVSIHSVSAGSTSSSSGWLWSGSESLPDGNINGNESGIGWISMNSKDCDTDGDGKIDVDLCGVIGNPIADYGVNIPSSDGPITGYAWSEHLGWVSFNSVDLSGCSPVISPATRSGNNISGGARILSIRDAGSYAGGWDGCINLSGTTATSTQVWTPQGWGTFSPYPTTCPPSSTPWTCPSVGATCSLNIGPGGWQNYICRLSPVPLTGQPYGVTINTTSNPNTLSGYAWSSDLGWIDFSRVSVIPQKVLHICREGIPISNAGLNFSLGMNQTTNLKAYFDDTPGSCTGNDVTETSVWTEESGVDAVSLSGTNPKIVTAGDVPNKTEQLTVTYSGEAPVVMNITVVCSETATCSEAASKVCSGTTILSGTEISGVCGRVDCGGTMGTRVCGMHWMEVAPR